MSRPTALPTILALAALLAAGCVVPGVGAPRAKLGITSLAGAIEVSLHAVVQPARRLLGPNVGSNRLTRDDIHHVVFKLYTEVDEVETLVATLDVPERRLDLPITFSRLQAYTSYRVRAFAYDDPGTAAGDLVSVPTGNNFMGFDVVDDDRPYIEGSIPIVMADVPEKYVTFWAGGGPAGSTDAQGTAARFLTPHGICIDGDGNVFVADQNNHRIRKITPGGTVSTLAGSSQGYADLNGTSAQFDAPNCVAADGAGNVYVTEANSFCIRKIDTGGNVSTIAGDAVASGTADGNGAAARFMDPYGIAAKADGTLFVTDDDRIRQIAPNGDVTTIAGGGEGADDGPGSSATFRNPRGLALGPNNGLFVADTSNHKIRRIELDGSEYRVTTLAGGGSQGNNDNYGPNAYFAFPGALAVDPRGYILVADTNNHKIRRLAPNGFARTFAGSGSEGLTEGGVGNARFDYPQGIAIGPDGTIYVSDVLGNTVRRIL